MLVIYYYFPSSAKVGQAYDKHSLTDSLLLLLFWCTSQSSTGTAGCKPVQLDYSWLAGFGQDLPPLARVDFTAVQYSTVVRSQIVLRTANNGTVAQRLW